VMNSFPHIRPIRLTAVADIKVLVVPPKLKAAERPILIVFDA
jgi:hypothetical protein